LGGGNYTDLNRTFFVLFRNYIRDADHDDLELSEDLGLWVDYDMDGTSCI